MNEDTNILLSGQSGNDDLISLPPPPELAGPTESVSGFINAISGDYKNMIIFVLVLFCVVAGVWTYKNCLESKKERNRLESIVKRRTIRKREKNENK